MFNEPMKERKDESSEMNSKSSAIFSFITEKEKILKR